MILEDTTVTLTNAQTSFDPRTDEGAAALKGRYIRREPPCQLRSHPQNPPTAKVAAETSSFCHFSLQRLDIVQQAEEKPL